uniref:Uncharacterized protein n=1 Tax=Setaria viridis TaxID=4556 RepID=A0A4U6VSR8_SETVI|nr:hypothetical protein SEVIR_2G198450v2 [Setaria viridis]
MRALCAFMVLLFQCCKPLLLTQNGFDHSSGYQALHLKC